MVEGQVKAIMKDSLNRFSILHNVESSNVCVFIHTKKEDFCPAYFYQVKGATIKNEDGKVKELDFNRDFLNKKFDILPRKLLTDNYLKKYFKKISTEHSVDARELYLRITCADKEANELKLALFHNSNCLKQLNLNDVFGEG
jgi:hypothetical protein